MDIKFLTEEQKKKKIAELKWQQYKSNARFAINNFNVPRGNLKELIDLQNLIKGNRNG